MNWMLIVPIAAGAIALCFALYLSLYIRKQHQGTERMRKISSAISTGARAFLFSEYKILVIFAAVLFVTIGFVINWGTALCFILGALFSTLAGYFGMTVATMANVRTANAAKESGMNKALRIAFRGGAVMGLSVVGLGVLGLGAIFLVLNSMFNLVNNSEMLNVFTGFSLGASSIALFARVGGGIYTKAADVNPAGKDADLHDIQLFLFSSDGSLYRREALSGTETSRTLDRVKTGSYDIVAVANAPALTQIQTKAAIASGPPSRAIHTSNFDFCILGSFSTL